MELKVAVSVGEFIDKMTILEIKSERIEDAAKLRNVHKELALLRAAWRAAGGPASTPGELVARLKDLNETLWDIEDQIRRKEARQEFDEEFIRLARAVYYTNDERAAAKRAINQALGSDLLEEKSYTVYKAGSKPQASLSE